MRAAVCREFGKPLEIADISLAAPGPGRVEVAIEACAVCHSDIHYIEGAWGIPLPAVFGHEAAGRIVRVGDGVSGWSKGDRVLVTLIRSCGACINCCNGLLTRCEAPGDPADSPFAAGDGSPLLQGLATGAFAERTVVDQTQIASIPESISADAACLLSCGVITGVGAAVNTARIPPGATVAVIGAGGVGLNAIQGARICGAAKIIAVDISEKKLADAREFGATHGILADSKKPHRQIRGLTDGRGVDFALVAVGSADACEQAMRCICKGGKLVIVGMPPAGEKFGLEPLNIAFMSRSLIGSAMGDTVLRRDIPWLLELYAQGRLKLDELITGRYPLEQINDAIQNTVEGKARRNIIVF